MKKQLTKFLLLCAVLVLGCTGEVWANTNNTYYSKLTVSANNIGAGSVYVNTSNSKGSATSATQNSTTSSAPTHTYYIFAEPKNGYYFTFWSDSSATVSSTTTANTTATVEASSTTSGSPSSGTCTATFSAVSAELASGSTFTTLEKSANVTGAATFTTTGADTTADFMTPTITKQSGDGTFSNASCTSWASDTLTVNYTFNAGGATGAHTAELVVASANGEENKTKSTITVQVAGLGDAEGTGVETNDVNATINGTVTIPTTYLTSQDQVKTPTISNRSGNGTFAITSWLWAGNVITINYSFNPNGAEGTTKADLNVALEGKTADSKVYQLAGDASKIVDYQAEVWVSGSRVKTGTFAECLSYANTSSANPTLKLRNNVTGITAEQTISKSMTLDLNGQTISGALTSAAGLIDINGTGINVTITDNSAKKEGKISNISASTVYICAVYLTKGNLTIDAGTFHAENTNGTASSNYRAVAVRTEPGTTLVINGGVLEGVCAKDYANGLFTYGTTTINDGTITGTGYNAARAIVLYDGTTTMKGGTLSAVTTGTTDAVGVYMATGANGVFNLQGGEVLAETKTSTAIGLYMGIAGATINVSGGSVKATTTTTTSYGIMDDKGGTINVTGGTIHAIAKATNLTSAGNASAYGVYISATKATSFTGGTIIGEAAKASYGRYGYGIYTTKSITIDGSTVKGISAYQYGWGVQVAGGTTTIKSGTILGECVTDARGVQVSGNVANTIVLNMEGGTIAAQTTTSSTARGICGAGIINMKGGSVYAKTGITTANSSSYGIYVDASANADTTESYHGTLNMTGGTVESVSTTTTAYGVCVAQGRTYTGTPKNTVENTSLAEAHISGGTILAKTEGASATTTAIGVRSYGNTFIEDGATITATPKTTTAYGIDSRDGLLTVNGGTITATATGTAYGAISAGEINSSYGYQFNGNIVINGGTFNVSTTTGETAYGAYATSTSSQLTNSYAGYYAAKGDIEVNGGVFNVSATTKTAYGVVVNATSTTGTASATPTGKVTGGDFMVTAPSTVGAVNATALAENFTISGGYYNNNTNLSKYKIPEATIFNLTDGDKYNVGYRYAVGVDRPLGVSVCKIGSTYFYSLENALTYAQQNSGTNCTIVMISDYILPKGNYTLPSNATLLVPYKADQTSIESHPTRKYNEYNKPTCFRNLTLAEGVHLDVYGTVQTGSLQSAKGQLSGNNGMPTGNYGMITMSKNSKMTIEANAQLYAWGYIVGEGEIDVRRDATVHEFIGVRDWRGGTCTGSMNDNSEKVFPLNQYYIQNIEAATTYRPGSKLLCDGTVNAASAAHSFDDVKLVGVHGSESFFMMDNEDVSEDTWVRKKYDAETDQQVYEINSSAQLGNLILTLSAGWVSYTFNSKDYVLPVTNNMKIHVLTGEMQITQNTELLPGAVLEVDKEASFVLNSGKNLYVLDTDEWGTYEQKLEFSPSWKTGTCPRAAMTDAHVNVHGTFNVGGGIYTSAGGADIFSTNSDAGTIQFNVAAPTADATIYRNNTTTASSMTEMAIKPAWLKNGDGTYAKTISTAAGNSYCYSNGQWRCWVTDGCFAIDKTDNSNWIYYAKPGDYVALSSNTEDANHLYHSQDLSRHFILMEGCQWWQVEQTEEDDDVYYCADNDTYYYYTGSAWAEKTVTVTWQNYDGSAVATYSNVRFGRKPKYLGTNPKRAMDNYYTYDFIGWLPEITDETKVYEDITYIANYEQNDRLFQITFKDGSTTIETDFYGWGTMPVCEKEPKKAGYILSWSPALGAVSGAQEYTAVWTAETVDPTTLKYTVTWKNYEGTTLQTDTNVTYGVTPSYSGATPTKPSLSDIDYVFAGWTPDVVPVTGNAVYTAAYNTAARKYTVTFKNQDGTTIETQSLGYGEIPACQNPPTQASTAEFYYVAKWDKQITAVTGDVVYTHAGFTAYKNTCRLTVAAGANGSVLLAGAAAPLTNIYDYGTKVSISATANEHYHFAKWSDGNTDNSRLVTVNQTISLTAQFAKDQYEVTWKNYDDAVITTSLVEYNGKPSYTGATPNRPNGCGTFYTFAGWSPNPSTAVVTAPTSFTAQYDEHVSSTLKSYKVSFNGNGAKGTMADQNFAYGTPQALHSNAFSKYYVVTYNYNGSSQANEAVHADATFVCWKDAGNNSYSDKQSMNIADGDCDATIALTAQWNNNGMVTLPLPVRSGYAFAGWYDAATNGNLIGMDGVSYQPTKDIVLYAHWGAAHTITFANVDGNDAIVTKDFVAGATPVCPTTPAKASTSEYDYTFTGWSPALETVTRPQTYTAQFSQTKRKYTVRFVNYDNSELQSSEVAYGTTPSYSGATPTRAADAQYTYTFKAWDETLVAVNGTATYKATYSTTTKQYTVKFVDSDGTVLSAEATHDYGYKPSCTEPASTISSGIQRTFSGWKSSVDGQTYTTANLPILGANVVYTAQYTSTAIAVSINSNGTVTGYTDWATAFTAVNTMSNTPTMTLWQDFSNVANGSQQYFTKSVVLDLNGYHFDDNKSKVFTIQSNATLTIRDSRGGGRVKVENSYANRIVVYVESGKFILESGEIKAVTTGSVADATTVSISSGSAEIKGGKLYATAPSGILVNLSGGTNTVSGGLFTQNTNLTLATGYYARELATTETEYTNGYRYSVEPISYTVAFDGNGATSGTMENQAFVYGTAQSLRANTFARSYTVTYDYNGSTQTTPASATANYTFGGWTNNSTTYTNGQSVKNLTTTNGATIALTAKWNGGSITLPTPTNRAGYSFDGWYDGDTKAGDAGASYAPTSTVILKAKWTAQEVTYTEKTEVMDVNGVYKEEDKTTDTKTGYTDTQVTAPIKKTGFTIITEGTTNINGDSSTVVTYKYERNKYTIAWVVDGTTLEPTTEDNFTNGSQYYEKPITKPADPVKVGYTFAGWEASATIASAPGRNGAHKAAAAEELTVPAENTTYTATWTPNPNTAYKVRHMWENIADDNYTEHEVENLTGTTATEITPAVKSYEGFTAPATQTTTIAADGSTVVTYNYTRKKYTITFKYKDGYGLIDEQTFKYGATISHETPTKADDETYTYKFSYWYPAFDPVTGPATYLAVFDAEKKVVKVTNIEVGTGATETEYNVSEADVEATTVTVKANGKVSVAEEKNLTTNNLIIEASETESGELIVEGTVSADNVYFDYDVQATRYTSANPMWYSIAVPFEVDAVNGIYYNGTHLVLGSDIDIMYYDGARRAANGKNKNNWQYVEDQADKTLKPGVFYLMAFAADRKQYPVRFTKKAEAPLVYATPIEIKQYASANTKNANWNCIANPALYKAYLDAGVDVGQVYVSESNSYSPIDMKNGTQFTVGRPVCVQAANAASSINLAVSHEQFAAAPARAAAVNSIERMDVRLTAEGAEKYADRIFVAASEEATGTYTIGADIAKAGLSTKIAQLWLSAYGEQLCKQTATLNGNIATWQLGVYAPQAGEYEISVEDMPDNTALYLTENGYVIWNLSLSPYEATLPAGNSTQYGLLLVRSEMPGVTTDVDRLLNERGVQKLIIDNKLFLIVGEHVYDGTGKRVK